MPRFFYHQQSVAPLLAFREEDQASSYLWCPYFYPPLYVRYDGHPFRFFHLIASLQRVFLFHPLKFLALFFCYFSPTRRFVALPFSCDAVAQLKNGWKLFFLQDRVVKKVFGDSSFLFAIRRELKLRETLQKKSGICPRVYASSLRQRPYSYTEELLSGRRFHFSSPHQLLSFYSSLVPHLMPVYRSSRRVKGEAYVRALLAKIERSLRHHPSFASSADTVMKSIHRLAQQMKVPSSLLLICTHGDLTLANALSTHRGIVLMDWEYSDYRSPFFDFWVLFFNTVLFHTRFPLTPRIMRALMSLSFTVGHARFVNSRDYLILFMLEKTYLILTNRDPVSPQRLQKWLAAFRRALAAYS